MKHSPTRDWLIDAVVILGLAGVSVFLLPMLTGLCAALSLRLGRTLFWVHSVALEHLLPHVIVGSLIGLCAAWLIRHARLSLALLPAVLLCLFYAFYLSFGPYPYSWGQSRLDVVIVGSWLLLITTSLLCARVVLKRRQSA